LERDFGTDICSNWISTDYPDRITVMARDLRLYARQTRFRLLIGFFVVLVLVGIGLIYLLWGKNSALMGLVCIGFSLVPAGLVWLILSFLGWLARYLDER
jgi:hypothetical protein